MKVLMPSATGGMYHSHRMRRLTGEGVMEKMLAEKSKPTSLEPRDRKLGTLAKEFGLLSSLGKEGRVRKGSGLEKLSGKLSELTIKPVKAEKHNITFDI